MPLLLKEHEIASIHLYNIELNVLSERRYNSSVTISKFRLNFLRNYLTISFKSSTLSDNSRSTANIFLFKAGGTTS
jgi:hypothetical protein